MTRKLILVFIISFALIVSCKTSMYEINEKLPQDLLSSSDKIMLVSSGQVYKYIIFSFDNINYKLAYDDENIVKFISVSDPNFTCLKNIKINTKVLEIKNNNFQTFNMKMVGHI